MEIVVVGAGFGGIAAAIELRRHGFPDVVVLEAAPDIGGTWFHNTYPGAACDIPSHLYSYSFAQGYPWSRWCAPQPEILDYLRRTARHFGVDSAVRTGLTVTSCAWDDDACRWTVRARSRTGEEDVRRADALVLATGRLNRPAVPDLPGMARYAGHRFHSARWDHGYQLRDRRVAVVGTGASAVQFVPRIAPVVRSLTVFHRSGNWILPRLPEGCPAGWRALLRGVPGLRRGWRSLARRGAESLTLAARHPRSAGRLAAWVSAAYTRRLLPDPEVRRRLRPDYAFGCRRVLFDSDYLRTLSQPHVDLVTEPIVRMAEDGLVTADGRTHPADCVIFATGFQATGPSPGPEVTGTGGLPLRTAWAEGPHAHLGIMVPGFPSMFLMFGPNSGTSGGSILDILEAQARWTRRVLQAARDAGAAAVEVRAEAEEAGVRELRARFTGTAWDTCDSWYRDEAGRHIVNWPGTMAEYARRTRRPDPADLRFTSRPPHGG
ncbi:flavin-containing monooxygenase [Streptomyces sp. CA-181903]|uniref:flavin-containing monooxygenase n=1 Tax=Streptomyces sp. CA-181903 TaxID=3240055 RepID=UPI003D9414E0